VGKLVIEERYRHFQGKHKQTTLELKEAQAKATNYLHQLSFASRVRDVAWADGIYPRFETFKTWWRDPAHRVDLNSVNIEDIPCTNEAIRRLVSLGQEKMPDAVGIAEFDYRPPAPEPEVAKESGEAREASGNAKATPAVQDPIVVPQGGK
jgi:formylglycine-generating enzyme required for sulfatase activity